MKWIFLIIAIIGEVIATSALKLSDGFTKIIPSIVVVIGYGITFYFFSLALKNLSVSIAYAVWSGAGIILISAIGYFLFKQTLDFAALIGISLIISGILIINFFSKSISH